MVGDPASIPARSPEGDPSANLAAWSPVAAFIESEVGFVINPDRYYLLSAQCSGLLARVGLRDPGQLVLRAKSDATLRQALINATTINESLFFRDVRLWDDLGARVLPELAAEVRQRGTLRILCCACSRGQEIYTLAMVIAENRPAIGPVSVEITACDIDTEVLAAARLGRYNQFEMTRGIDLIRSKRWFIADGDHWRVRPELQDGITFRQLNLTTPFDFPLRFDLIFCRNVLIYFSVGMRKRIIDRLGNCLTGHGYLGVGGSETLLGVTDQLQARRIGSSTLYQKRF